VLAFIGIAATMVLASIMVFLLETRWRAVGQQPQLASE
jgi:ACS family tartrate transporter-like MFS transporter